MLIMRVERTYGGYSQTKYQFRNGKLGNISNVVP